MARLHVTKHQVLVSLGLLGIVIVAIGAGGLVFWLQNKDKPEKIQEFSTSQEQPLPQAAQDAQKLAIGGKPEDAQQKITDALSKPNVSNDDKYDLYLQQGVTYSNQKLYQKAWDSFKQAEAVRSDFTISHLIGEQAEALGDKQTAITYYKKAIGQLNQKEPSYNSDKEFYQNKVKELGGTL